MKIKINRTDAAVLAECLEASAAMYRAVSNLSHITEAEQSVNRAKLEVCTNVATSLRTKLEVSES